MTHSRVRAGSRLSEAGRVAFRVTKSMLKAQDSSTLVQRFLVLVVVVVVVRSGRKRKETLYRHVETVKGKPGERSRARDRKALSSLFARSRESSVTRILRSARSRASCCIAARLSDRNSFHPFPPHPLASSLLFRATLSREPSSSSPCFHSSLSPSLRIYLRHPRRFVFPAPGPATFHPAIMHKTGVRASTSVLTPGKRFADVPT